MKIRRPVMLVLAVTLLALGAGAPPALAQPGFGGSGLTITALSPDTTTPYSGTQDSIYIQLSGNAPSGGTVVTTTSSNQSAVPVPSSVTVTAGSSVGQVDFTAGTVTSPTSAKFTATLGSSSMSVTITVTPVPAPALFDVHLFPPEVIGGGSVTVEPDLNNPAPSGGVTVSLSSSNPSLAPVPASVVIPGGQYLASVSMTTGTVKAATDVTITAALPSGSVTNTLQIDPPETVSSLSLSPATTTGSNGSSGTVTLSAPAPSGGTTVNLQSSNPSVASVPAATTVPGGQTTGGFTVSTTSPAASTTVTITASIGSSSVSATLTVNPQPPPTPALQSVTFSPGSVSGGGTAIGTVTLNVAAPAGGAQVLLASSNTAAAAVPASVTIPAGATSATFTVHTASVSSTTTVSIGGEYGENDRAGLLGVTGGRHGGSVLPPPPSGQNAIFVEPFEFGPMPENDTTGASPHPFEISLAGTLDSFTSSVESGSVPAGMSLVPMNNGGFAVGIQGTPSAQGLFAFVLKFTLSDGTVFGQPYVWRIVPPLVISQASLPAGKVGVLYSGGFSVSGGVPPYSWSIAQFALPPGLAINASTGQITGSPTQAGTFNFRARVTDSDETQFFEDSVQSITISS
jgi:Putative Ig domain